MSRGPVPSQLCLLSALPDRSVGDKVRFLGCVTAYSTASASLTLGHLCPEGTNVAACVDVRLVLGALQSEMTRVGEWLNVIGYVTARRGTPEPGLDAAVEVPEAAHVQALAVWPTGPLDVQRYEQTFGEKSTRIAAD
ncbi:telomere capping, CST complex subunit domain-containing protein [Purpureocillium lilacinum]|uniref:Telomere capping, CST complex subunit domain-containing protein n=1 Tax=Purpureocillium lilacinum TaxID=33203 RepID=A0A179GAD6_PURLI|nr:telomere capping, CST complex subunit domain-containing protein [Purpureocillium lilacinum]KAK4089844.1 hypothetical protein Purlil1_5947 [Purpureocillium lilacinum]OAQ74782.1 telomere capping, CST complex subunit domain-containing protein [Purpureocillium lilacinum]OAQ82892.1 telomere capping, CST complex subunit domain-containing protein [Purpureocillium lilacinum]PWI75178.1 hypothetical protein PCL_05836 [Purpureocillium lilacinum]GJN70792.1 hypothetical protein PLICBS_004850 [Purpureoci